MIKSENGGCIIEGSYDDIKGDFRIFLKTIKLLDDKKLLEDFLDVLEEEMKSAKNNSDN